MVIVGIDPGLRGAVAILADNEPYEPHRNVFDCPVMGTRSTPGGFNEYGMYTILRNLKPDVVYIERQQTMPKQGLSSSGKTMYGYGLWIMAIVSLNVPYHVVTAQAWKKFMLAGLDRSDKNVSRMVAMRCFPSLADKLARVGDDGRAEALLIAEYGRRTLGGKEAVLSTTPTTE